MITNATRPLTKKTSFDTTTLRRHTLKNRIWRSATWLALADNEGNVTDEIVRTYEFILLINLKIWHKITHKTSEFIRND